MNLVELKRASCYEELELLVTLQGLQRRRAEVFNKLANYYDDTAFCIPTKTGFVWVSKRSLKRIEVPQEVDRDFYCTYRSLTSLKGAPEKVGRDFWCYDCSSLTSLEGAPEKVSGSFRCSDCTSLTSLEGAPREVGGDFDCSWCSALMSLEGAPKEVGKDFDCSNCSSLTSLEGAPEKVSGVFDCSYCSSLPTFEIERLKKSRSYKIVSNLISF